MYNVIALSLHIKDLITEKDKGIVYLGKNDRLEIRSILGFFPSKTKWEKRPKLYDSEINGARLL